jgi:hypothetical protein
MFFQVNENFKHSEMRWKNLTGKTVFKNDKDFEM